MQLSKDEKDDDDTENMSTSTFNQNVMKFDSQLMFTEEELLQLTQRLIHLFATLQKVNVAHRNIKPANLVFSQQPSKQKSN